MSGNFLDIVDDPYNDPAANRAGAGRRFVGVHFTCCDIYARVYVNREETAYEGNCPRCGKRVQLRIGPGGTDARFFTVS